MSRAKRVVWLSASEATEEDVCECDCRYSQEMQARAQEVETQYVWAPAVDGVEWGPLSAANDGHDPLRCRLASFICSPTIPFPVLFFFFFFFPSLFIFSVSISIWHTERKRTCGVLSQVASHVACTRQNTELKSKSFFDT